MSSYRSVRLAVLRRSGGHQNIHRLYSDAGMRRTVKAARDGTLTQEEIDGLCAPPPEISEEVRTGGSSAQLRYRIRELAERVLGVDKGEVNEAFSRR